MADATVSNTVEVTLVGVRVPPSAPNTGSPSQDHARQGRTALMPESFSAADQVTLGKDQCVDQERNRGRLDADDHTLDQSRDHEARQPTHAASTAAEAQPRKLVLVVEDDEAVSSLLVMLLEERGYDALPAMDGQTAIALARKHLPHLITLDLALPGSDGHEVLSSLKGDPTTRDIPIVVISAFTQILPAGERKKLAYLLGKPFDVTEVLEIVQATVGNPYV
jgi:CheY-like chemotaxis protein